MGIIPFDKWRLLLKIISQNGGLFKSVYKLGRFDTLKDGKFVGCDSFGNKYYENPYYMIGRSRWVEYNNKVKLEYDASQGTALYPKSNQGDPIIKPPLFGRLFWFYRTGRFKAVRHSILVIKGDNVSVALVCPLTIKWAITPEWYGWLHYRTDRLPCEDSAKYELKCCCWSQCWLQPHEENHSGTDLAFYPYSTTRPHIHVWDDSFVLKGLVHVLLPCRDEILQRAKQLSYLFK